jgi:hypothetical protein
MGEKLKEAYASRRQIALRSLRASICSLGAYILLWQQSVFDGSYILVATIVFFLAMTSQSQRLVQFTLGVLFLMALLSDWMLKLSTNLT